MAVSLLYVTVASRAEAESIAEALVAEKLVACVNIMNAGTSVYEWNGELQKDSEHLLLIKTQARLQDRVMDRVVELHSYEVPCVLTLPIHAGFPSYMEWVVAQTRAAVTETQ